MISLQTIKIIAKKEVKYLFREKSFYILLGVFMTMAALSTVIGWATIHTLRNVYDSAVIELTLIGQTAPAFPLGNISSLSILKNMIIYVVLIGSLLSIILGYFIGINDRISGTMRLLFSRKLSKTEIFLGKFWAINKILFLILSAALVVSIISAAIFNVLDFNNGIKILEFYGVSYVYMIGFSLLSLALAVKMESSASAILYSLFIWIVITFALPELGSALHPTGSLNPVLPPTDILQSPLLLHIHQIVIPFSISEHFKELSSSILGIVASPDAQTSGFSSSINTFFIFLWGIITFVITFVFFQKIDPTQNNLSE